jgi:type II secretory pathway component PulJ
MVSLTILAGLMAVTYSGFSVALTMWEKTGRAAEEFDERQTAVSILQDQIRGALPLAYVQEVQGVPRQRLAFEGRPNRILFVSRTSWREGGNAVPRWIELTWDKQLVIDERQILPKDNRRSERVLWHVESGIFEDLQFQYLVRAQPNRAAEWVDSWDFSERPEMPAAVAIRYTIKGESVHTVIPLDYAEANWRGLLLQ